MKGTVHESKILNSRIEPFSRSVLIDGALVPGTKLGEVTCYGLASRSGGVKILVAPTRYRNRDKLRQL